MASALMHIAVAKEINEKLLHMNNEYLVGSIAPDLAKLVGEPKKEGHFLRESKDVPDLDYFLSLHDIKEPYNMGYFIHLLTDKIFFKDFLPKYYTKTQLKLITGKYIELSSNEKIKLIYEDYSSLNIILKKIYNLNLDFLNDNYNIKTDISEVPADEINLLLNDVKKIVKTSEELPLNVFHKDEIIEFIETCVEEGIYAISKQEQQIKS